LVHFPTFQSHAESVGFELVDNRIFHKFINEESTLPVNQDLSFQLIDLKISQDEWEALGIYRVFVFKKIADRTNLLRQTQQTVPKSELDKFFSRRRYTQDDIINLMK